MASRAEPVGVVVPPIVFVLLLAGVMILSGLGVVLLVPSTHPSEGAMPSRSGVSPSAAAVGEGISALDRASTPRLGAPSSHLPPSGAKSLPAPSSPAGRPHTVSSTPTLLNITPITGTAPPLSYFGASVYDPAAGYVLYYGGDYGEACHCGGYGSPFTWSFHANTWTNLTTTVGTPPPPSEDDQLVWDPVTQQVLYFPGQAPNIHTGVVWAFANGTWSNVTTPTTPDFYNGEATYDAGAGKVVYVGGGLLPQYLGYFPQTGTWTYQSGIWTNITVTAGPTPHTGVEPNFAYDPIDGYDLLYGGLSCCDQTDYTWILQDLVWQNITTEQQSPPPADFGGALVYDPQMEEMLLLGGYGTDQIWVFVAGQWDGTLYNEGITFPGFIIQGTATWDDRDGGVVFWSDPIMSHGASFPTLWVLTEVPAITGLYYDNSLEVGSPDNITASYIGGWGPVTFTWYNLPAGCASTSLVVNCMPTTPQPLTWGYLQATDSAGDWTQANFDQQVQTAVTISISVSSNLEAGQPADLSATIRGGYTPYYSCVWTINGGTVSDPSSCSSTSFTPATAGWYNATLRVDDDYGWFTTSAPQSFHVAGVLSLGISPSATSIDVGQALTLVAVPTGGYPPVASCDWWANGAEVGSNDCAAFSYTPTTVGPTTVQVTTTDSVGDSAASGLVTVDVNADLWLSSFGASSTSFDLGQGTTLTTVFAGGTAPYKVAYAGLPAGCSGSSAQLVCSPTATGTSNVTVTVTDADGATASGSLSLAVAADPTVSLSLSSSSAQVGSTPVTFTAVGTGGTGPLDYTWAGLPAGCGPAGGSVVSCAPEAAGTYTVTVRVSDAQGETASADTTLTVTAAAVPTPTPTTSSSSPSGPLGLPGDEGALLLGILVLLAIIVVLLLAGMMRGGGASPASKPTKASEWREESTPAQPAKPSPSPTAEPAKSTDASSTTHVG